MTHRSGHVRDWLLVVAMTAVARPVAVLVGAAALVAFAVLRDWVPFVWIGLPVLVFTLVDLVTHRPRPPGRPVRPAEEPELSTLVRQVAERVAFRVPLAVRIVPEPDVGVQRTRAGTATVFLGLPLVRGLTTAELAVVVAREFVFRQHTADRRTALLLWARDSLVESLDDRLRAPAPLVERLLRASRTYTWPLARAADAGAAAVVGTPATRGALTRLATITATFHLLTDVWTQVLGEDGYPEDLYDALDAALADPYVASRVGTIDDDDDPMSAAVEPPLGIRLTELPDHPAYGWEETAPVPLHNADTLTRWCVRDLTGADEPRSDVRLLDLPPGRLDARLRETAARLAEAMGQDSAREAVRAAADAVADGTWPGLARAVDPGIGKLAPPLRASAGRDVLVGALTIMVGAALLDSGWTRASRWTVSALIDPTGELVDTEELLEQAVDGGDPARLRALLRHVPGPAAR
ncbi:hypothetical protein [Micromonospora sp. NBS 11-29]|uniref:hypothetical protein n=1 Tax=Micromonospora sp. NBS 11-29 TaxID=1960879 RepID=UPI000B78EA3A|nr:hypothetical protein [Micromonospora sp. NBS 11-29]